MLSLTVFTFVVFRLFVLATGGGINVKNGQQDEVNSKITYPNDFLIGPNPQHYYHYHHSPDYHRYRDLPPNFQHSPQFHREHGFTDKDYDVTDAETKEDDSYSNSSMKIPVEFIQSINDYNVSDLLLNFVDGDVDYDTPLILNRFADSSERNAAVIPKAAGCAPELVTVKIISSNDPSILYIPQCTRVERCGGCCSHTLLSCQPKETETLTFQVMKTQYTGGKKLKFVGKEVVLVEKHTKCKCDCKVKEEECNKYQEYRESECRCACTNTDEEKKCYKSGSKKLWNPDLCACQCRDVLQCSTGYSFDQKDCSCVPTPMRRRFANNEWKSYVSEAEIVSPLVEDEK